MAMHNPVHPGAIVRQDCLKPLGLSVTQGARHLGVGRQTLSNLVNGKTAISIEMAYRLSKAFGSTPETWLGMQLAFDLARSRHLEHTILDRAGRGCLTHFRSACRGHVRRRRISPSQLRDWVRVQWHPVDTTGRVDDLGMVLRPVGPSSW